MLKIAMICMLIAVIALAVGVSFMKKPSVLTFLLKALTLIALVCLGFTVANYKDDFSGFSILVILSVLPMFLSLFDLKSFLDTKNAEILDAEAKLDNETNENEEALTTENADDTEEGKTKKKTKKKKLNIKKHFFESNGKLATALGIFLSTVCISVATLYVGKETFLGALIGILIGIGATCVLLALKKIKNLFDIFAYFLLFASIGLLLGNIILALMYSFSVTNIMFCLGALLCGVFVGLNLKFEKNYLTPIYYLGVIFFFLSILL